MANNYAGGVRDFWRDKFNELPDGARILDIATGNGAIATMAVEIDSENGRGFFVTATDLATINPSVIENDVAAKLRSNIVFHSNVPCESQPLQDNSCDLVTSQFGFEYSDVPATIQEMRRLLVPGGKFIAISHHADSALITTASAELEIYELAFKKFDLFGRLSAYFTKLGDLSGTRNSVKRAMRNAAGESVKINEAVESLRRLYPDSECSQQIEAAVSHLAMGASKTTEQHRHTATAVAAMDFRTAQARLSDMVNAAMDQDDIDALGETARSSGFETAHCLRFFGDDDKLAGWQIHIW